MRPPSALCWRSVRTSTPKLRTAPRLFPSPPTRDIWTLSRSCWSTKRMSTCSSRTLITSRCPLSAAKERADKGHLDVIKVLLEHKADVNVRDTFYNATPLTWAVMKGHAGIVQALLEAGA